MIVVGGAYFERCAFPEWDSLFGSGLRAAVQLSKFCPVQLHTPASPFTQRRLAYLSNIYEELDIKVYPSRFTHIFDYVHSLTPPVVDTKIDWGVGDIPQMNISGDRILTFGFYEQCLPNIDADWAVYDPQSSPIPFREFGRANHLAIVMNAAEARVWGGDGTLDECAQRVAKLHDAEIVVVKNGPYGALVYDSEGGATPIPAYRADGFFKIGSGDVFSAIFAYLWTTGKHKPKFCAETASKATAFYVSTKQFIDNVDNLPLFEEAPSKQLPIKLYLAGPFFTIGERWAINDIRDIFQGLNVDVISPIHDIGVGLDSEIAAADLKKLRECNLVFAVVAGADPGTLFEIGYAFSIGKPVVAFHQNMRPSDLTMLRGTGCIVIDDLGAAIYEAIWRSMAE